MKASSATEQYAGGIVGYNSGTVEDCRTDVDTSAVMVRLFSKQLWSGAVQEVMLAVLQDIIMGLSRARACRG